MTNNDRDRVKVKAHLAWHDISVRTTEIVGTNAHAGNSPSSIDATAYLTLKQAKKLHRKLGKAIHTLEAN